MFVIDEFGLIYYLVWGCLGYNICRFFCNFVLFSFLLLYNYYFFFICYKWFYYKCFCICFFGFKNNREVKFVYKIYR